jgi:hypothetical protein
MQCLRLPKHYFMKLLENARFREAMNDLISMYPTVAQVEAELRHSRRWREYKRSLVRYTVLSSKGVCDS